MRNFLFILTGAAAVALLLLPAAAGSAGASPGTWLATPSAESAYLNSVSLPLLGATAPAARLQLENSTLQHNFTLCSIENDVAGTSRCSVTNANPGNCSISIDQLGICSAFYAAGGVGTAICSTHIGGRCSVLPPPFVPPQDVGECSVAGINQGGRAACSVFGQAGQCSVLNPSQFPNQCTSLARTGRCSVLNFNSPVRGFCSAGRAGPSICSSFVDGAVCSIRRPARGVCTSFKGAPLINCSIQAGGHCSIDGGAAGNPCRLP